MRSPGATPTRNSGSTPVGTLWRLAEGVRGGGDAARRSRRKNVPEPHTFLRSSNDGGVEPRSGQAVSRETMPPRRGRKTLGRGRAGDPGQLGSLARKSARAERRRNPSHPPTRGKPQGGESPRGERCLACVNADARAYGLLGSSRPWRRYKAPPRILDARVGSAHGR